MTARLLKQVLFGGNDGRNTRGRPKGRWTDRRAGGLVQERYLQLVDYRMTVDRTSWNWNQLVRQLSSTLTHSEHTE